MMEKTASIRILKTDLANVKDNALLIGFFKGKAESKADLSEELLSGELKALDNSLGGTISSYIKDSGFKGEKSEVKSVYIGKNIKNIVLVGLGEEDKLTLELLSGAIASVSRKLRDNKAGSFSILLSSFNNGKFSDSDIVEKTALSALIGLYQFTYYKTKDKEQTKYISRINLISGENSFEEEVKYASIVADAVNKTRDLVNTPPNVATPEYIADYAKRLAGELSLKCTVLDEKQILDMKMGCLAAVAKGSANKPRFVVIEYCGKDYGGGRSDSGQSNAQNPITKNIIAIVGKGVTFDSGGLNVKPYPFILNMKVDMAGAAASLHILEACARLKLPVNVVVLTPLCENMISADSYRPDDVLTAYNGMTVEIKNTDAEGRLILADALAYAAKLKPRAIIDIATLTGASTIVLGYAGTPFLSTDEKLSEMLKNASKKSLEKVWELPLWPEYEESIKSEVADVKNISEEGDAGVIIGATFLKNFVGDVPWVHIDIGTTVWSKAEKGLLIKGATGATVRLMMELIREWKS